MKGTCQETCSAGGTGKEQGRVWSGQGPRGATQKPKVSQVQRTEGKGPKAGTECRANQEHKGSQWEVGWASPTPIAQGEFELGFERTANRAPVETERAQRDQASCLLETSALGNHFSKNRAEGEMWAEQRPAPPMSPAEPVVTQNHATRTTCTPRWGWGLETTDTVSTAKGQRVPGACQNLGCPVTCAGGTMSTGLGCHAQPDLGSHGC